MEVLISKIDHKSWELSCGSKTIQVFNGDTFMVVRASHGIGAGRVFHQATIAERLTAAIASYKAAPVKAALESLAESLA